MTTSISISDKKVFIRWVLKNYQLKRRECVWILNYLLSNDELLQKIRFVDDGASYCSRGIVMSAVDSTGTPFRYYKDNIMTADAEKAFHDMRLDAKETYIQLNTGEKALSKQYLAVLEENPHMPEIIQINEEERSEVESLLSNSLIDFQKNQLLDQIDITLDNGDKEKFYELTNLLLNLKETAKN
ncbi:gp577 [Bacillus phage G]|uniref:Gp577 n=1 Tax=Bacillus phage G TaxID=2884420 RepID=G3MAV7_9CAUD|nr:gp577 [Bacillus phage G]AEO93822.1 gp577 [Bacillus phage G]